jgi:hypothetical protein
MKALAIGRPRRSFIETQIERLRCFWSRPIGHVWEPWGFSERCGACGKSRRLE